MNVFSGTFKDKSFREDISRKTKEQLIADLKGILKQEVINENHKHQSNNKGLRTSDVFSSEHKLLKSIIKYDEFCEICLETFE